MAVRLIRQFTDLDPAWMTQALRESGAIRGATVTHIGVAPVGVGAGFLGQVARLRLGYDRPEAASPATIIGKLPTLDPGGREICRMFKFYEREIRFYRELAAHVPVRVPRCHASVMDVAEDDYLLLLEDLSDRPIGDDATGCSAAEAERAVRSVARLHRAWWDHAELGQLDLDAPQQCADPPERRGRVPADRPAVPASLRRSRVAGDAGRDREAGLARHRAARRLSPGRR